MVKRFDIDCIGYSIAADWYEGRCADKVMLVLPGWTSSKKKQQELTEFIVETTGTSALVIDYSGHGESPFDALDIRPAQHFLEVITAFDWIEHRHPEAQISVVGCSYGGYHAARLAIYRDFKNLVLRVPAIYTHKDFYSQNRYIDRQHERRYREDQAFLDAHSLFSQAEIFQGRTLVVWHGEDEYVPKQTTDKYIQAFKADSYFAEGWPHSFKKDAPEAERAAYLNAISSWLTRS